MKTLLLLAIASIIHIPTPALANQKFDLLISKHLGPEAKKEKIVLLVDYSLPITAKRFFVYNTTEKKILLSDFVGHANKSGRLKPKYFSNKLGSNKTSLGTYKIGKKYQGAYGESYNLIGKSKTNSRALKRRVVIHNIDIESKIVINYYKHKQFHLYSHGCFTFFKQPYNRIKKYLIPGTYMIVFN